MQLFIRSPVRSRNTVLLFDTVYIMCFGPEDILSQTNLSLVFFGRISTVAIRSFVSTAGCLALHCRRGFVSTAGCLALHCRRGLCPQLGVWRLECDSAIGEQ